VSGQKLSRSLDFGIRHSLRSPLLDAAGSFQALRPPQVSPCDRDHRLVAAAISVSSIAHVHAMVRTGCLRAARGLFPSVSYRDSL
jgi:hypothetical protein